MGKFLVWDATYPDTYAPSYISQAKTVAREVAAHAEDRKRAKYSGLPVTHFFVPVAIETSGVIGPKSKMLLEEFGSRMMRHTGDEYAITYLLQRLSIEIQRGNSASIMGSI